jgi:hypothetical protein
MITTKVQPFDRNIDVAFGTALSPASRSAFLAQTARRVIDEVTARDEAALGAPVGRVITVDGRAGAPIEQVRPDGVIVALFDVMPVVLHWIAQQLWKHSPFKTGRYQHSHRLLVDGEEVASIEETGVQGLVHALSGQEISPGFMTRGKEFVFMPIVPYARPIERGWSKQAPDGVYQAVAALARAQFGSLASISFGYRELAGLDESIRERRARPHSPRDMRQPVIIVTAK